MPEDVFGLLRAQGCFVAQPYSRRGGCWRLFPWSSTAQPARYGSERSMPEDVFGLLRAQGCLVAQTCSGYGVCSASRSAAVAAAADAVAGDAVAADAVAADAVAAAA